MTASTEKMLALHDKMLMQDSYLQVEKMKVKRLKEELKKKESDLQDMKRQRDEWAQDALKENARATALLRLSRQLNEARGDHQLSHTDLHQVYAAHLKIAIQDQGENPSRKSLDRMLRDVDEFESKSEGTPMPRKGKS